MFPRPRLCNCGRANVTPLPNIGISTRARRSATVPTPNTRSISALSSPRLSNASFALTGPSSQNLAGGWIHPPSLAWPTHSSPLVGVTALVSTPSLGTPTRMITANPTQSPRLPLLWEAMREFLYVPLVDVCEAALKTPWLSPAFVRQYRSVFRGYPSRIKLFGPLPSFQEHMDRLRHNRRFFGVRSSPGPELLAAVRYPFTDRDFREFAYAIPRDQVVGVGKRRYLLKR